MTEEEYNMIRWWEGELKDEDRKMLMNSYEWHGSVEERHKKLKEMYLQWKSELEEKL